MIPRRARSASVRGSARLALLPPAAFAVHQLRYWLAYGSHAGAELQRTGHSYLHSVVPWLVALVALAAGCFMRALGGALRGRRTATQRSVSFTGLWLGCAAALVGVFAAQELLEGLFATGHPEGLAAIFGDGGGWAIPAALAVGLVLAAVFRGARWIVDEVARRRHALPYHWGTPEPARRPARSVDRPVPVPLLAGWSTRGPPA